MEQLRHMYRLAQLKKFFAKHGGIPTPEYDKKLSSAIRLLYAASKKQIYKVAEKIAANRVPTFSMFNMQQKYPSAEESDDWGFKVGDVVKVRCSLNDFKYLQKETLGWGRRLLMMYGKISIVTEVRCDCNSALKVYTPDVFSYSVIHAGVLEKVSDKYECPVPTPWSVGDYVKTKTDKKVVEILQRRRGSIPDELIGKRGRIVAITTAAVIVTFDEIQCYDINSYLLVPCENKTPLSKQEVYHTLDLKVGEKVQMISNLKKLISNQLGKGGWSSDMCELKGKKATIVRIDEDENIFVQLKQGRTWCVNPASVMKMTKIDMEISDEDLEFLPEDRVKFKLPPNVRSALAAAGVPSIFLEYLKMTAIIASVDDDYDYFFKYNRQQRVPVYASMVKRATPAEIEEYNKIESQVESLGIGDTVFLDIGPPNYVRAVLEEVKASGEIVEVLTNPAKLVGYADDNRAVIECKSGARYKLKKKFLTVPDKFDARERNESFEFESISELQQDIQRCVKEIHETYDSEGLQDDYHVGVYSMMQGVPPSVQFKVRSMLANGDEVTRKLAAIPHWGIEILCEGLILVTGFKNYPHTVKVTLSFENDEFPALTSSSNIREERGRVEEGVQPKAGATPFVDGAAGPGQANQAQPARPQVENLEDFSFVCLYDPTLAQNVYFPYVVQGRTREPMQEGGAENRNATAHHIHTHYIDKVDSIQQHNN